MDIGAPNIDAMTPDEARVFAKRCRGEYWAVARELFPNAPQESVVSTVVKLADYAEARADAGEFRLAGKIQSAMSREIAMDLTFNTLPEWARW